MNLLKYILTLMVLTMYAGTLYGYDSTLKEESLLSLLDNSAGKYRVDVLNQLSSFYDIKNPGKSIGFASNALFLSQKIRYKNGYLLSLRYLGSAYYHSHKYDSSLHYYEQLYAAYQSDSNKKAMAETLLETGWQHYFLNNSEKSYEDFSTALETFVKVNYKPGIAEALHNLSFILDLWGNYEKSFNYLKESMNIATEIGDKRLIALNESNMGQIYKKQGNYLKALVLFDSSLATARELKLPELESTTLIDIGETYLAKGEDSIALDYYKEALLINEGLGFKEEIANCQHNIGKVYFYLGDYNKAIEYYEKSIAIKEEVNLGLVSRSGTKSTLSDLAQAYYKTGNVVKALQVLRKSVDLAEENNIKEVLVKDYLLLSDIYSDYANYRLSNIYLRKYIAIKDSLFNEESNRNIIRMQTVYETEKTRKENEYLTNLNEHKEKKIATQTRFTIAIVIVLVLVIILALVLFRSNSNKKKINELLHKQKEEIQSKNIELEAQKKEILNQKENIEFAYNDIKMLSEIGKDITSSIKVETIVEKVYENVSSLMKSTVFGIGIYNRAKKRLDFPGAYENGRKLPFFYNELTDDNRLAVWCFKNQKEIIIHEYMVDSKRFIPDIPEPKAGDNTESLLYVPLTLKDKKIGVITVQSFRKHIYSEYHLEILRNIANYASIALENADAYTRIERQNKKIEDYNVELEKQKEEIQEQAENLREANEIITAKNTELTELNADKDKYLDRINYELSSAAEYVHSLIPKPLDGGGLQVHWRFIPSAQLGGDAFGYHYIDNEHVAFYLLDVCGHGIGPALHSISVFNTLKYQALPETDFRKPSEVLKNLNKMFQMSEHHDLYFTLWYSVFNTRTKTLVYAGAGHPPAILCNSKNKPHLLEPTNTFIGGFPEYDFSSNELELHGKNHLYIFSDGAYEVRKSDNTYWTVEELSDYLFSKGVEGIHGSEMDDLYEFLRNMNGKVKLNDDFSIMKVTFS